MDGTRFPTTARLTGRWLRGRIPTVSDWTRGIPFLHKGFANRPNGESQNGARSAWRRPTARRRWPSPTRRWDCCAPRRTRTGSTRHVLERRHLPLVAGYQLGDEIPRPPRLIAALRRTTRRPAACPSGSRRGDLHDRFPGRDVERQVGGQSLARGQLAGGDAGVHRAHGRGDGVPVGRAGDEPESVDGGGCRSRPRS